MLKLHVCFTNNVPFKTQVQNGNRKCTDVLFLLMLFAAWAAMTLLGLIVTGMIPHDGLEPGNPKRLINGIDYEGRICGVGTQVKVTYCTYFSGWCLPGTVCGHTDNQLILCMLWSDRKQEVRHSPLPGVYIKTFGLSSDCIVWHALYLWALATKDRENIYYLPSGNGVCVEDCPMETNYTQFICYDEVYPEIYSNETGEVNTKNISAGSLSTLFPKRLARVSDKTDPNVT